MPDLKACIPLYSAACRKVLEEDSTLPLLDIQAIVQKIDQLVSSSVTSNDNVEKSKEE